jgi:hypothetical protein
VFPVRYELTIQIRVTTLPLRLTFSLVSFGIGHGHEFFVSLRNIAAI